MAQLGWRALAVTRFAVLPRGSGEFEGFLETPAASGSEVGSGMGGRRPQFQRIRCADPYKVCLLRDTSRQSVGYPSRQL